MSRPTYHEAKSDALVMAHEVFEHLMAAASSQGVAEGQLVEAERILKNDFYPLVRDYDLLERTAGAERTLLAAAFWLHLQFQADSGYFEVSREARAVYVNQLRGADFLPVILPDVEGPRERKMVLRRILVVPKFLKRKVSEKEKLEEEKLKKEEKKTRKKKEPRWFEEIRAAAQEIDEAPSRASKIKSMARLAQIMLDRTTALFKEAHELAVAGKDAESVATTALVLSQLPTLTHEDQFFYAVVSTLIFDKLGLRNQAREAHVRVSGLEHYLNMTQMDAVRQDVQSSSRNYNQFL